MADAKISADPTATLVGDELIPVVQGGVNKVSTPDDLATHVVASDAELAALAGLTSAANKLPYFTGSGTAALTDLTAAGRAILDDANAAAQLTTLGVSAFVQTILDDADAGTVRTTLGLGALAVLGTITASLISDASANGRSLITAADYSAMRTLLGLVIGTNVQAQDAELAALAGLTSAADKGIQFTGSGTAATFDLTSAGKALLDDANAAAQLVTLGAQAAIPEGRISLGGTTHYSIPGIDLIAVTTRTFVASRIYYEPFFVLTPITLDQLALEVTTGGAGGTLLRMALYAADTNWLPTGARIVDSGTVAADGLGVKTASINTTLQPGRYLKAVISDGTPVCRALRGGGQFYGIAAAIGASALNAQLIVAGSGNALPDPGTAPTTVVVTTAPPDHVVVMRVSVP